MQKVPAEAAGHRDWALDPSAPCPGSIPQRGKMTASTEII